MIDSNVTLKRRVGISDRSTVVLWPEWEYSCWELVNSFDSWPQCCLCAFVCYCYFAPTSIRCVLIKSSPPPSTSLWRHFIRQLARLCCYKRRSKYVVCRQVCERASSTVRLMFWFAVIQVTQCAGIIRCSRPCVNHNAPLNNSCLYILFMTIFSHATWKFAKAVFAGRNRAAKAFRGDEAAFISRTGWEKQWDVGFIFCRQALSFIYSQYHVEILNRFFFICKTFAQLTEKIRGK